MWSRVHLWKEGCEKEPKEKRGIQGRTTILVCLTLGWRSRDREKKRNLSVPDYISVTSQRIYLRLEHAKMLFTFLFSLFWPWTWLSSSFAVSSSVGRDKKRGGSSSLPFLPSSSIPFPCIITPSISACQNDGSSLLVPCVRA